MAVVTRGHSVMFLITVLVCVSVTNLVSVESSFPPEWRTCKKDVSDRDECLRSAINDAVQSLVKGNKKLGVLPVDPMEFGRIHTKGDPKGPVALDIVFKNFVLYNLKNLQITEAKLNGRSLKLKGKVPGELIAKSPYTVTGRILALPITGDGPSNFTFWDGEFTFDLTFKEKPESKNGKQYFVVEKLVERSHPRQLDIYLGNLFNGNQQLGDTMNKVLNENWELVWTELKPLFEEAISEAFLQLSNRVFSKIPVDELELL